MFCFEHIYFDSSNIQSDAVCIKNDVASNLCSDIWLYLYQNILCSRCLCHQQNETQRNRAYPFSTYPKFSEKLIFLTPRHAHVRVRIRGFAMLVFRKILRTYLMNGPIFDCPITHLLPMFHC